MKSGVGSGCVYGDAGDEKIAVPGGGYYRECAFAILPYCVWQYFWIMSEHFTRGHSATPKNPERWSFFDPSEELNASRRELFSLPPDGLMPLESRAFPMFLESTIFFVTLEGLIPQKSLQHHIYILQRIRSRPLPRDEIPLEDILSSTG